MSRQKNLRTSYEKRVKNKLDILAHLCYPSTMKKEIKMTKTDETLFQEQETYGTLVEYLDDHMAKQLLDKDDAVGASVLVQSILGEAKEILKVIVKNNPYQTKKYRLDQVMQFINRAIYVTTTNRRALRLKENNNE